MTVEKNCRKCGSKVNAPFVKNGVTWVVPMGSPHGKPRPMLGVKPPAEDQDKSD